MAKNNKKCTNDASNDNSSISIFYKNALDGNAPIVYYPPGIIPLCGDPIEELEALGVVIPKEKRAPVINKLASDIEKNPKDWAKYTHVRVSNNSEIYIDDTLIDFKGLVIERSLCVLYLRHPEGLTDSEIKKEHFEEWKSLYDNLKGRNKYDDPESHPFLALKASDDNESISIHRNKLQKCIKECVGNQIVRFIREGKKPNYKYSLSVPQNNIVFED